MNEQINTIREFITRSQHDTNCASVADNDCFCDCGKQEAMNALAALAEIEQAMREPGTLPMPIAPKDGSMVRLLVDFTEGNLEDTNEPQWTIGFNNHANTGEDQWQFAGWNWSHDCFTEGSGTPVGWAPFHAAPPEQQPQAEPDIHEAQGQIEFLDKKNNALSAAIRKVMARLADLLDEDQFKEIEEIVSFAGVQPQAEEVPLTHVLVPVDVLKAASESLGSFVSDQGWTTLDMQAMDNIDAILAQQKGGV